MNLSPEQIAQAQEMMNNMKPGDMQNMFNTMQQNPHLMQQAMSMMGGNAAPRPQTSTSAPSNKFSSFDAINALNDTKAKGNDKYNKSLYQEASTEYLAGILDIESLRGSGNRLLSDSKFIAELNDMEIKLRNNYCTCKVALDEPELIGMHASEVVKLDPAAFKGHYHMALFAM